MRHQRLAELNALRTDQLYKMLMISGYYHLVNERLPGEMEETLSKSENIPDGALSTCNCKRKADTSIVVLKNKSLHSMRV